MHCCFFQREAKVIKKVAEKAKGMLVVIPLCQHWLFSHGAIMLQGPQINNLMHDNRYVIIDINLPQYQKQKQAVNAFAFACTCC